MLQLLSPTGPILRESIGVEHLDLPERKKHFSSLWIFHMPVG